MSSEEIVMTEAEGLEMDTPLETPKPKADGRRKTNIDPEKRNRQLEQLKRAREAKKEKMRKKREREQKIRARVTKELEKEDSDELEMDPVPIEEEPKAVERKKKVTSKIMKPKPIPEESEPEDDESFEEVREPPVRRRSRAKPKRETYYDEEYESPTEPPPYKGRREYNRSRIPMPMSTAVDIPYNDYTPRAHQESYGSYGNSYNRQPMRQPMRQPIVSRSRQPVMNDQEQRLAALRAQMFPGR